MTVESSRRSPSPTYLQRSDRFQYDPSIRQGPIVIACNLLAGAISTSRNRRLSNMQSPCGGTLVPSAVIVESRPANSPSCVLKTVLRKVWLLARRIAGALLFY